MNIRILAAGRLKASAEAGLVEDYLARAAKLGRAAGIREVTSLDRVESKLADAPARRDAEAGWLMSRLAPDTSVIALDERGRQLDSEAFSGLLKRKADDGTRDLAFVIGGPDGLDESVRKRAEFVLSLGAMTWPHRLARVMLAEQIYRAVTIMVNHPYHRP